MSDSTERRAAPREPAHLVTTIEVDGKETGKLVLRVFVPGEEDPRAIAASVIRSERIPLVEGLVWDFRVAVALDTPDPALQALVHSLAKK
jgi:hypothetical protein